MSVVVLLKQGINMLSRSSSKPHHQSLLSVALLPFAPVFALFALLRLHLLVLLQDLINFFQGCNKRRASNQYLTGNFTPVKNELHEQRLPVEGAIPEAVNGAFVRYLAQPNGMSLLSAAKMS